MQINIHDQECWIGIEHQSYIDHTMFQRVMEYDFLAYQHQHMLYEYSRKHHLDLQKITAVMTLVLYYGDKKWTAPKNYSDMMKSIPQDIQDYVNIRFYPLIDLKSVDEKLFHNTDNQELLKGMKFIYNFPSSFQECVVSWEVARLLSVFTHDEDIYQQIKIKKGGKIDMCETIMRMKIQARNDGKKEGKREGKIEGMKQGQNQGITSTLIKQLKSKFGILSPEMISHIQTSNSHQLDQLTLHIFDVENENDVLKILKEK